MNNTEEEMLQMDDPIPEMEQGQPEEDMTPEEAKASLGFATMLSENMMPQEGMVEEEQDMESEEATGEPTQDVEALIDKKLDEKLSPLFSRLEEMLKDEPEQKETT